MHKDKLKHPCSNTFPELLSYIGLPVSMKAATEKSKGYARKSNWTWSLMEAYFIPSCRRYVKATGL